jgi:phage tail sheath protein FI
MPSYYTPGIYFEKIDTATRNVLGLRTDIPGFVGIAERGPLNTPVRIESWKQFWAVFGGFIPQGYLAYAVQGFFENGGRICYVTRITDLDLAKRSEILLFDKSEEITQLAKSVNAYATEIEVTGIGSLSLGDFIILGNDSYYYEITTTPVGNKFTISPELANSYGKNTKVKKVNPSLKVRAINEGQWGKKLKITLNEDSLGSTVTSDSVTQIAAFSIVNDIKGFEEGSLVRVFQNRGGTIIEKYHYVESVVKASKKILWDTPLESGISGFDFNETIYFNTLEFALKVTYADKIKEAFEGLSLNPLYESRYVENIVKEESNLISVVDLYKLQYLGSVISAKYGTVYNDKINDGTLFLDNLLSSDEIKPNLPTADMMMNSLPDPQKINGGYVYLRGGFDGINTIKIDDFIGDPSLDEKLGLRCYEETDEVSMVCIPDIMIRSEEVELSPKEEEIDPCATAVDKALTPSAYVVEDPPEFDIDDIERAQRAMVEHCEMLKDRIAILDSLYDLDISEVYNWRLKFDSKYAALYYPWIVVNDPLQIKGEITREIPPSGYVSGVFARTDLTKGVHKAPANEEMMGVRDLVVTVTDNEQDILNPAGVNCLRNFPGRGILIWGSRSVSSDTTWRFINIRRLLIMIEESIEEAMQWAVFEPNDVHLRNGIILAVTSFLETLWSKGALAGNTASEAFFVKCDEVNNPQSVIDEGKIITDIGVAPSVPAEFIVFRIGKIKDKIEIIEEGAS